MVNKRRTNEEVRNLIAAFKKEKEDAKFANEWAAFHIIQMYIDLLEWTLGEKEINVRCKKT